MTIYRIETEMGVGVYQHDRSGYIAGRDFDEKRQPLPHAGLLCVGECGCRTADVIGTPGCLVFGFPSLEALVAWFPDPRQRRDLHCAGVAVSVYAVPDTLVKADKHQAVFRRCAALKVDRFPIPVTVPAVCTSREEVAAEP